MEEYVTLEIKEARVLNVTCPGMTDGKKCDAPFSAKDIKEIVKDKNILDKYERFLKLKTNDNFTECPYCNQMQKGTRRQPRVVCERKECGKTFCFIHSAAHPNETCAEYKRKNKERFAADRKYLDENSIYCPNMFCRTPIYKTSGCNHMTCSRCASEFCYLCGGLYMGGLHFHELNCLGCPNQQSSDGGPNSNKSWRRSLKSLFGWPLMLILCSCPLACLLGLFLCFEACWAALFALCLPCILVKNCRLMRRESRRSVDEFRTVACAGPVFCGLMWRACGCGMAGCRCCLQVKWLYHPWLYSDRKDVEKAPTVQIVRKLAEFLSEHKGKAGAMRLRHVRAAQNDAADESQVRRAGVRAGPRAYSRGERECGRLPDAFYPQDGETMSSRELARCYGNAAMGCATA
eukprot:g80708.t1